VVVLVSGYCDALAEAGAEFPVVTKPPTSATVADAIPPLASGPPATRIVADNTRQSGQRLVSK
jgi:hypothetical protein